MCDGALELRENYTVQFLNATGRSAFDFVALEQALGLLVNCLAQDEDFV